MIAPSQKCKAKTRKHKDCRNRAIKGTNYCYVHSFGKFKKIPLLKNPNIHLFGLLLTILLWIIGQMIGATKANQNKILNGQEEIKNIIKISDTKQSDTQIIPFTRTDSSFNILILPFEPLEDCKIKESKVEETLRRRLLELKEEKKMNIQVKIDTNQLCPTTFEEGRKIGKKFGADLVVWGDYFEKCFPDTDIACLKYYYLKDTTYNIKSFGKTGYEKIESMVDLKKGYLQNDLDYLIYWTLGIEAYNRKKYNQALQYFKFNGKIKSKNYDDILFYSANCYNNIGLYDSCLFTLNILLERNNLNEGAHFNLAKLLMDHYGRYREAESHFLKAININQNFFEAYSELAFLYYNYDQYYDKAKHHLIKALQINPNFAAADNNLAIIYESNYQNFDSARIYYKSALKNDPDMIEAYINLADLYESKLDSFQLSKSCYEKALKIDDNNPELHASYGFVLQKYYKDYKNAEKQYLEALQLNSNYDKPYNYLGILYIEHYKDRDKSKEYYLKALTINENFYDAHNNLGNLLMNYFKDYKNAELHFLRAIKIDSSRFEAIYNYASLLKTQYSNFRKAKKYYIMAGKIEPNNYKIFYQLAFICHFHLQEFSEAKNYYEITIKLCPNHLDANSNLAILYSQKLNKPEIAKTYFLKALKIDSSNYQMVYNYAYFLRIYDGNVKEARKYYLNACMIYPNLKTLKNDSLFQLDDN